MLQIRCVQSCGRKSFQSNSEILTPVFQSFYIFFFFSCSLLRVHHQLKKAESEIQSSLLWSNNFFVSCGRVLLLNTLSAGVDRADRIWAGTLAIKSHQQGCWWLWQIAWLLCCGSASHSDFLNLIISRSSHKEMLWQAEVLFQWLPATHTCLSKRNPFGFLCDYAMGQGGPQAMWQRSGACLGRCLLMNQPLAEIFLEAFR